MKYAIIQNGMVKDIILASPSFIQKISNPDYQYINIDNLENQPGIGWSYENNQFLDTELVQAQRDKKLKEFRKIRDQKLLEADIMINELALKLRFDLQQVRDYREALLNITNNYKDSEDRATSDIEAINLEDESFWPTKPESEE